MLLRGSYRDTKFKNRFSSGFHGKTKYIVLLPREGIEIPGYSELPKIGETTASSERKAVTQYVARHVDSARAGFISDCIDRKTGLENCAIKMPVPVASKGKLSGKDLALATQMALAQELFSRNNTQNTGDGPERYFSRAGYILDRIQEQKMRRKRKELFFS